MDKKDEELLKKLLPLFKVEAQEHLYAISAGLLEMGKSGPEKQAEIVETVFREAHSMKGAARSVNLTDIVAVCQSMESAFSAMKRKEIKVTPQMMDLLHQAVDYVYKLTGEEALSVSEKAAVRELICKLDTAAAGNRVQETGDGEQVSEVRDRRPEVRKEAMAEPQLIASFQPQASVPQSPSFAVSDTIRISIAKLDALLLQVEEMIPLKLATAERVAELRELKKDFNLWKKGKTENRHKGDPLIASMGAGLITLLKTAEYDQRSVGAMVDNLLEDMKKALMLPMTHLLEGFPRFARDLSRDAGKNVELTITGGEIEIDRRILEEIKDPLIHLVRNCIDHGIESADDREKAGKSACGDIRIVISSRDNRIEIAVSDDGAGIDSHKVKDTAVRRGIISQEDADRLSEHEALLLVFRSGVTTSSIITDISGRGLGLAIVREKVEKLNGTVTVDTKTDIGTTFRLRIPITIATFRGVLVRLAEQLFVIPSANVERVARIRKEEIKTVENRETISFDNHAFSLVRLGDVLEMKTAALAEDSLLQVMVLSSAEKRMAFLTDEILHEQEVLVKPLGRQLSRVRNIAGATVLGSGKVAPILNVSDLIKSVVKGDFTTARTVIEDNEKRLSVLVVEDSITARTLLKNILESAGYHVKAAVDGVDGFMALKSDEFDLVVSDVDMPRMNGFDLTAKIRSDKKLSELPVVLVTALDSREDKERGIDVGANAYIVKSSFDQSNLLEVIGRLI